MLHITTVLHKTIAKTTDSDLQLFLWLSVSYFFIKTNLDSQRPQIVSQVVDNFVNNFRYKTKVDWTWCQQMSSSLLDSTERHTKSSIENRDSQDNPRHCIPDPWFCSIAKLEHIPLHLCYIMWKQQLSEAGWWSDASQTDWHTPSYACLSVCGSVCKCVACQAACPPFWLPGWRTGPHLCSLSKKF